VTPSVTAPSNYTNLSDATAPGYFIALWVNKTAMPCHSDDRNSE